MPKRSKIDQLPTELRTELDVLLANKALRIEDIVAGMRDLGVKLSKSGVNRYQQKIEVVGERIRRSRDIAEALVHRFGDAPEDKPLQLNIQFLHSAVMDIMGASDDDGAPILLSPKNAMELARAVGELARASKTDADRLLRARKEVAEKTIEAVEGKLKAAQQPGLTKEMVAQIRQSVLGVET